MQVRLRFGPVRRNPLRVKGSMQCESAFCDTWRLTFGGSLARNAGFGDLAFHILEEVSYESLVLETWRFPSRGSLERV